MTAGNKRDWHWWGEIGGALGDLGITVPLAYALVVTNGYPAPRIFLLWGLVYIVTGLYYRVPVSVQPLKAMAAIAIAGSLDLATIGTAAFAYGLLFVALAASGLVERIHRLFPVPLIRGIQLGIGLMLGFRAFGLIREARFLVGSDVIPLWMSMTIALAALAVLAGGKRLTKVSPLLLLVPLGMVAGRLVDAGIPTDLVNGAPVLWTPPRIDLLLNALLVLILPQFPVTLGNAVVAAADSCHTCWPERSSRVSVTRLAASIGLGNMAVGLAGGFPVCHGAGGMAAHARFGGRTGRTTVILGLALVTAALIPGGTGLLFLIPLPLLGAMLLMVAWSLARLVATLPSNSERAVAVVVGGVGYATRNLAFGLAAGWLLGFVLNRMAALNRKDTHGED